MLKVKAAGISEIDSEKDRDKIWKGFILFDYVLEELWDENE